MAEASVTKSVMETYTIRANHEHATIGLRCWSRPVQRHDGKPDDTYYCGEIMINSSFGSWANTWTACGRPFKEFLIDTSFDYAFTKFMGTQLERYDGEATVAQIKRDILERRRTNSLDGEEAREAWDCVTDEDERITSDETSYGYAMWDIGSRLPQRHPMRDYFNDASAWPRHTHPDRQAEGFWRELWPHFVAELAKETACGVPAVAPLSEAEKWERERNGCPTLGVPASGLGDGAEQRVEAAIERSRRRAAGPAGDQR